MTVIDETLTVDLIVAPLSAGDLEQIALYAEVERDSHTYGSAPVAAFWTAAAAAIRARAATAVSTLAATLSASDYRLIGGRVIGYSHPENGGGNYPIADPVHWWRYPPPQAQTWFWVYFMEAYVSWGALQGYHPYGGLDPYWWRLRSRNPNYLDDHGNMEEPDWWLRP